MRRRLLLRALPLATTAAVTMLPLRPLRAQTSTPPPELATALPDARLQGSATMRFLGLQIYDIQLWSSTKVQGDGAGQPLALCLTYARALSGRRIAERSLDEMRRIADFSTAQGDAWLAAMTSLFPDVRDQDRLTGLQQPGARSRFYFNGQWRGDVDDPLFTRLFFGIWLSPRTSEPSLRQRLLGAA